MIADDIAQKLNEQNAKRQAIQNKILLDADAEAKRQTEAGAFCLFIYGADWHGGVVGIVAGRLKEKYNRPCCVGTSVNGIINGSGRSLDGIDIGKIIQSARGMGILTGGGGHKAAAGFELAAENAEKFREFLNNEVAAQLGGEYPSAQLHIDFEMDAGGASFDMADDISKLAPFGMGNAEPVLCLSGGAWTFGRAIGTGAHLSGTLRTSTGTLPVVGFNMADGAVGRFLLDESNFGSIIRAVGKLKKNEFRGREVQLVLEDISL